MKKRLKGLLALSLALCMVLAMTTGVASAENYGIADGVDSNGKVHWTALDPDYALINGDTLNGSGTSGQSFVLYVDGTLKTGNGSVFDKPIWESPRNPISVTSFVGSVDASWDSFQVENLLAGKCYVVNQYVKDEWYEAGGYSQNIIELTETTITYRFIYNANGGTATHQDEEFLATDTEGTICQGDPHFTKLGYQHSIWTTKPTGGIEFDCSKSIQKVAKEYEAAYKTEYKKDIVPEVEEGDNGEQKAVVEINLYAQYDPNQYSISFDPNFETDQTMDEQELKYDEEATLNANTFTREGYTFTGWNTEPDGSGESYTDKQEIENLTAEKDAKITLYAQWQASEEPGTTNPTGSTGSTGTTDSTGTIDSTGTADSTGSTDSTASTDSNDPANGDETDTGHSFNILPWLMMATASIIGVVAAVSRRKMAK